jgi:hypothetical protein
MTAVAASPGTAPEATPASGETKMTAKPETMPVRLNERELMMVVLALNSIHITDYPREQILLRDRLTRKLADVLPEEYANAVERGSIEPPKGHHKVA